MNHPLLGSIDETDARQVWRVVVEVVRPAHAMSPDLWDWSTEFGAGRLVDAAPVFVPNEIVQDFLSEADALEDDLNRILEDDQKSRRNKNAITVHQKLDKLTQRCEETLSPQAKALVAARLLQIGKRLMVEVFQIHPRES